MLYICGDSFGVSDPEYGPAWMDLLEQPLVNLCQISASNLLIAQQVDQAIAAGAQGIIVLCTSSTRSETRINGVVKSFSWLTASTETTTFTARQLSILHDYFTEFHDLEFAIYNNECIIETMLARLTRTGIPFLFDQGGFEHPTMGGTREYFSQYNQYRSQYCLWDHAQTRTYRPYYHVTDSAVHKQVAKYYQEHFK